MFFSHILALLCPSQFNENIVIVVAEINVHLLSLLNVQPFDWVYWKLVFVKLNSMTLISFFLFLWNLLMYNVASLLYVKKKKRTLEAIGVDVFFHKLHTFLTPSKYWNIPKLKIHFQKTSCTMSKKKKKIAILLSAQWHILYSKI